jgi:hypothetical protein
VVRRVGALPLLKIADLIPIPTHNINQIRVYANSNSRKALDNYIEFRRSCGENITPKSPLFRREFDKRDIFAVANDIKPITKASIKIILRQVLYSSGIRTPVPK